MGDPDQDGGGRQVGAGVPWSSVLFGLLLAGCATPRAAAPVAMEPAKNACVVAGDNCVANGAGESACRAAQASCLAMSEEMARSSAPAQKAPEQVQPAPRPPLSAVDEATFDGAADPLVAECASTIHRLLEVKLGGRIDRTLVTRSSRWGTVWRADVTTGDAREPYVQRVVCSAAGLDISPLRMSDPSRNTGPLPGP